MAIVRNSLILELFLFMIAAVPGAAAQRRIELARIPGEKTVVSGDRTVRRVNAAAAGTELRPNEYAVVRWADETKKIPPSSEQIHDAWSVGFGFIGVTPSGREIRVRPVIESVGGGLSLAGDSDRFQGRIYVGLRDNSDPDTTYSLPHPISLLVGGQADELMPHQFTIDHTNLPFVEVSVASRNPPNPTDFNLIAAGTSERATIRLPVAKPQLALELGRSLIQGLGLETATISVTAPGLQNPAGRVVTVTGNFSSVDPIQVRLDDHGVGTTTVRSVSIGTDKITATSPPLDSSTKEITFSPPIAFLIAAIAGGVLGAAIARMQQKGKKKNLQSVLIRGVLTGIVTAALYAIGVNLLPIHPTANAGEVLSFGVAAVGGFLGFKV